MSETTAILRAATIHTRAALRIALLIVFGLVIPVVLIFQAHQATVRADQSIDAFKVANIATMIPRESLSKVAAFDYGFASLVLTETSNRQVMLNKQYMKMAVVHVGFAVLSVSLMFIFMGIEAGGIDLTVAHEPSKLSAAAKITSTGVLVFVLGAAMVTVGGVLPNEYTASEIPAYNAAPSSDANGPLALSEGTVREDIKAMLASCVSSAGGAKTSRDACIYRELKEQVNATDSK